MEVTAANVNERSVVPALIREDDEVVYGDAGYTGIEKRDEIKVDQHLSAIQYRMNLQKPYRKNKWEDGPDVWWFRYMEYPKSRVRSKVEYAFLWSKKSSDIENYDTGGLQKIEYKRTCYARARTSICWLRPSDAGAISR